MSRAALGVAVVLLVHVPHNPALAQTDSMLNLEAGSPYTVGGRMTRLSDEQREGE